MLKGRFQYLKRIRKTLKDKGSLKKIIRVVVAAAVLHNILLLENDEIPDAWIELQLNCYCNADVRGCRLCFPDGDTLENDDLEHTTATKRDLVVAQLMKNGLMV
ncbi:hypothetical protein AeRB84_016524 [Aphanomyces euteiches]|nr:hypothetical protein AeRB84_016524 [Aphanomyces euteiches]